MSLFNELKRRNVFKVGVAYLITAWLLIQVADILLGSIGAPPWVLQAIFIVLGIGLFISLLFAWAYELTTDGLKRESEVDRNQSIAPQTGRKLNHSILLLMVLVIAYLLFDKFYSDEPGPQSSPETTVTDRVASQESKPVIEPVTLINKKSIAVLPFDNRSNREEDQFFTDGIHDDLLTTIAQIGSMKVISRTSVMEYKETTKKIPEIAAELGVANILEGGIQRSGDHVRINVQLIDAHTDEHLWAQIYDRELTADNLFAIQSEISKAIADALQATLSPEEERRIDTIPTDNLVAHDAYLKGRQLLVTRESESLKLAVEQFNRAVELDPDFAMAWVGVADANALLANYGYLSREESEEIAEHAINRALEIDDGLGEAYTSLGLLKNNRQQDEASEAAFRKAIELSPNYATAYHWYSLLLRKFPLRIDETIEMAQKAAELDPRSYIISENLAGKYADRGLYSMAESQLLKVIELEPNLLPAYMSLSNLYANEMGRYDRALSYSQKALELDPNAVGVIINLFFIYLNLGDLDAAENMRNRLDEIKPDGFRVSNFDVFLNAQKGNLAAARESADYLLNRFRDRPGRFSLVASAYIVFGEYQRARELFLLDDAGWTDPEAWDDLIGGTGTDGCLVSWLFINTGDSDLGRQLLQQTTVYLAELLPGVLEHADKWDTEICYLAAGDKEKALQHLETKLAHNHLNGWKIRSLFPMYDLIRHEPRYQAALAEREQRIKIQREAIAKLEAKSGS